MTSWTYDIPDLEVELQRLLAQIPRGRVTTYGDLADALGLRMAARWVGEYLRDHPHSADCSCHRVVRKDGTLGLYLRSGSPSEKAERLRAEGIAATDLRIESIEAYLFRDFETQRPLSRLVEFQHEVARHVCLCPDVRMPEFVAGLDVSYAPDQAGVGAAAIVEAATGRLVWSTTLRRNVDLPYISSLLTFRELPLLMSLFQEVERQPLPVGLYLVDGNGILHPRAAGVAACFGVVADVPTIGVAKSQLCGRIEEPSADPSWRPVIVEDRLLGAAIQRTPSSHRLFVSPGQKIDVRSAANIVINLHFGHRLPEPIYWADRLSRAEARRSIDE